MPLSEWRIVKDQPRTAAEHMALDERLVLEALPAVRFFTWAPPAMSLGWKQPLPAWLNPLRWASAGLEWVERPTGGGIAFHGSDVSIAVAVPRALGLPLAALMSTVCQSAVQLCRSFGAPATSRLEANGAERITYCLTQESPYAVCIDGRKIAGFALRRYQSGWLVQGSLLVRRLPDVLARAIPPDVLDELRVRAVPLATVAETQVDEDAVIERWAEHWPRWWDAPFRLQAAGYKLQEPEAWSLQLEVQQSAR